MEVGLENVFLQIGICLEQRLKWFFMTFFFRRGRCMMFVVESLLGGGKRILMP